MSRWWGYSKELLFKELDLGFSDLTTISDKETRYKKKPDAKTARILASYYNTQGELKKAVSFYEEAAKYDPENDYAVELFQLYFTGYRKKIYTVEEIQAVAEKAVTSEQVEDKAKIQVYAQMTYVIKEDPKDEKMLAFLKQGHERLVSDNENVQKWAKDAINISYALYVEEDAKKAVTLKKASLHEGWQDNPGDLNNFAWWCFENKINLVEADRLGRKGVKLAKPGREKGMILDTVAEIVNLAGYPEDSYNLMQQAVKEDPENEYYKKQLERFRKLDKGL